MHALQVSWWHSQPATLHTFYIIALVGGILLLAQIIMTLVGAEHSDLHGESEGGDTGHSVGLQYLSLRTIMAFATGLGWMGVILTRAGCDIYLTTLCATVVGFILAWSVLWLMRTMRLLASDGTLDYANAVQQIGTVVVSIQPLGQTGGQIEILIQGRLAVVGAISDPTSAAIAPGTKVRVIGLADRSTLRVAAA